MTDEVDKECNKRVRETTESAERNALMFKIISMYY